MSFIVIDDPDDLFDQIGKLSEEYDSAQEVGLFSVPVTIRELSDEEALQLALVENLQREDLNPVEETEGILQLLALRLKILPIDIPPLLYKTRLAMCYGKQSDLRTRKEITFTSFRSNGSTIDS